MRCCSIPPLACAHFNIHKEKIKAQGATESFSTSLQAVRRLLMRVEDVQAVPWLWASDAPSSTNMAVEGASRVKTTPTPLVSMLAILRRRTGRPRLLLAFSVRVSDSIIIFVLTMAAVSFPQQTYCSSWQLCKAMGSRITVDTIGHVCAVRHSLCGLD